MFEKLIIILMLILIYIKVKPNQIVQNFSQIKHEEKDVDAYNIIQ